MRPKVNLLKPHELTEDRLLRVRIGQLCRTIGKIHKALIPRLRGEPHPNEPG